jgi:hypothetical protein
MSERVPYTVEEFLALSPRARGYLVYMYGERDDQPNVPNESNPYPSGSADADAWDEGQRRAVLVAQDSEE